MSNPLVGSLDVRSNLGEIAAGGSTAQSAACANLGAFPITSAGPLATQVGADGLAAIIAALGYVPYNSANPNGYAPVQSTFVFTQDAPTLVWIIVHNLNKFPDVTIMDNSGNEVEADIAYVSPNHLNITFGQTFTGLAYLN